MKFGSLRSHFAILTRSFGDWTGHGEIEATAVNNELGHAREDITGTDLKVEVGGTSSAR